MSGRDVFRAVTAAALAWPQESDPMFAKAGAGRARCQGRADGEFGSHRRGLSDRDGTTRSAYRLRPSMRPFHQSLRGRADAVFCRSC
jgi:hypothetical protein